MRSPKDASRQFDRFRSYVSDHLTFWLLLLVAVAVTLPAVLAGATAAREGESVVTTVDSKVFVEPAIQPLAPFATLTVNSIGDAADINTADNVCDSDVAVNEQCTLRAAIQQANATAGDDTINFDATVFAAPGPYTIQLASALPDLSSNLSINGPGANLLSVSRDSFAATRFRIFTVTSAVTVNISGLTVTGGFTADGPPGTQGGNGGGIHNDGTLTLSGVAVSGNQTGKGGSGAGGGSGGGGGGINNSGTLTISNSTISGNTTGAGGTGTILQGHGGTGGGIINAGTLTISNSTISGNTTGAGASGGLGGNGGPGGGIYSAGTVTISNSTISGNTKGADGSGSLPGAPGGGGIFQNAGSITLKSTIVAGNSATSGPDIQGTVQSDGFNLIQNTSNATINQNAGAGPNITGLSPDLGPLASNGGPTQTHALLSTSPAIDQGNSFGLTTDQRGQTRPFDNPTIAPASNMSITGDNSDIGAYEVIGVLQTGSPSFVVNTTADTNDGACTTDAGGCTLREAITAANANPGSTTITFSVTGTISLLGALPNLTANITISGPGASQLTVSGNNSVLIFYVDVVTPRVVTFSGLTIDGGYSIQGNGGIYNNGTGTVNVTDSILSNHFGYHGAAIFNNSTGTINVTNSTLSDNNCANDGGSIYNNTGTVNVTNSTIINSLALNGGAVSNVGTGTVNVINSTLSNNSGGIYNASTGTVNVTNSTVTQNTDPSGNGGGISNDSSGAVRLRNSIVALNAANFGPDLNGSYISLGHNLIGKNDGSTGFTAGTSNANGDLVGTTASPIDPLLADLAANGGPTPTHALLPNSPAIDKGDDCVFDNSCSPSLGNALTTDQRGTGFTRKAGAHVDIGAFESNYAITATAGNNQTAFSNTAFGTQLEATVTESGVNQNGISVTFTAPNSGASGTFQTTGTNTATVTTDSNGVATASVFTANSVGGSYSAIASIGIGMPTASFNLTNNAPPTITAASGLSRQQDSPVSNSQIASVTDDGGAGSVTVTVISANPSNGVTVSSIQNTGGNITANIVADCSASNASFTLQASDGLSTTTTTLNVGVTANTAPVITYTSPQTVPFNGSLTVTPTAASDNGTVSYQVLAGHGLTTAPTVDANGVVSITNAQPAGAHTITVRGTDNCDLMTNASFTLNVASPSNVSGTKTVAGPFNEGNTVTYTIMLSNSGPAAQLDNPGNEFTDVLPSQLTLVSASATSGTTTTAANTVNWNGSIPAGSSVTITITATINDVPDGTIVSNQGTISYDADGNGTNEASRLTDDPAVGGTSDPTSFAAVSKSDLTIAKSHGGNFSGGQMGAAYTITVNNIGTGPTTAPVTVTDTVPVGLTPTGPNGVVNGWTCAINGQTLTCTRNDALAGGSSYPPINLTVNVANPAPLNVVNTATVAGGGEVNTANNTASDPTAINCSADFSLNNTSPLMISRFRENGPAGPQDEFVEIYNPNPIPHTVASGNCNGGGYGVYASAGNGTTSNTATLVCYIPNGTVIPAGGYYLCTGVTYSLSNLGLNGGAAGATATGDAPIGCGGTCGADIPNDAGLVLTNKAEPTVTTPENFGVVEFGEVIYDKVGFGPYGPAAPAPGYPAFASIYCEGGAAGCLKPVGDASTGAACTNPSGQFPVFPAPPACYGLAGQYEFLRRQTTFSATDGTIHQDTNNSGNDFILIAPNPATNMGQTITGVAGVTGVLGAAGPYNRNAPPDISAVKLPRTPFDGPDQLGPRNVERRFIPDPTIADLANNPLGTFVLRFKYTNNSGLPVNGIRFEVDNLSTLCGPQVAAPTVASVATGDARNLSSTPGCGTGSFTAIFKALNSTAETVVDGAGTAQFVNGTVMEDLSVGAAPGAGPLSPKGGGIDSTYIINPSSNAASVGDGVTGGVGNFATPIGTTDPTKVIRVKVKFGVVRSGRFILLLVPMARNSPAP